MEASESLTEKYQRRTDMQNPAEIFAQARLKQEQLLQQLAATPISEVVGVVLIGALGVAVAGARARNKGVV